MTIWYWQDPFDPKQFCFCGFVRVSIAGLIGCILAGLALAGKSINEINVCQLVLYKQKTDTNFVPFLEDGIKWKMETAI